MLRSLASKAIQGPALTLESVDYVESSDCLAAAVLGVGDSITDNVLQEDLEDTCREQSIRRASHSVVAIGHQSQLRNVPRVSS